MSTIANRADGPTRATEDSTFALHALLAYTVSLLLIVFFGSRLQIHNLNLGLFATEICFIALPAGVVLFVHRKMAGRNICLIPFARQIVLTALIGVCAVLVAVFKGIATRKSLIEVDTAGVDPTGGLSFLLLVLVAPFCEELLFRPVIQHGLARHWGNRTAVLLTALLFGLFHLQLLRFTETFVIGLFSGIVFLKTRNLWCSVVVHSMCNAFGPMLWRWSPHLGLLFNPASMFGLTCLALSACYYLGEKSPSPLKGLRQRLRWAAFGTVEPFPIIKNRSRAMAPLAWGIVISLLCLLGYSHMMMLRHLRIENSESDYVVSQIDDWVVVSTEEVQACSELIMRKSPDGREDLILQLPFQDAELKEVRAGAGELPFSRLGEAEYSVDVSFRRDTTDFNSITVLWRFPMSCLSQDEKWGYRTPLKSLVPSDSFSLRITALEDSGFLAQSHQPFTSRLGKPRTNYGSCGMGLVKAVKPSRNAQPNGPASGSQPIRSDTNRTSSAAGSRR